MRKIWIAVGILGVLLFLGFLLIFVAFLSLLINPDIEVSGNGDIALIPITGELVTDTQFSFGGSETTSTDVIKLIEKADEDPFIEGIILEINSPGGSAVASEEISNAVKKTKKPKVAWIREAGASGAYWVASSADHIVASRMSIVGSIGATASYLKIGGLLNKYNITYERLVSAEYKDAGTPFREMTPDERSKMQKDLEIVHREFARAVAENRKAKTEDIEKLANGDIYMGEEAFNLKLIDQIGGKEEALDYLNKNLSITGTIVEYKKHRTIFESLSQALNEKSFHIGRGIGASLIQASNPGIRT